MSKIELLIQKAHGGLADVFITSKGEWYGKTYDMRNYISQLRLTRVFYVLNWHEFGVHFTIVRPLNVGRTGDYMAAWIYIPNTITVNPDDLVKLISLVQHDIMSDVEQYDNLRPLLTNIYSDLRYLDYVPVQQTNALAYRLFGQNTDYVYLGSLLAQGLDQYYYKMYKSVFFIDIPTRDNIPPTVLQQMCDLSNNGFEQPAYLFPPQALPVPGMEIFVNHAPFRDIPIKTTVGSKVKLLLHRNGYNDVVTTVNVIKTRQPMQFQGEIPWEKEIHSKMFQVLYKGRSVTQYQLIVNGNQLLADHPITISEYAAKYARVEVMVAGCSNYQAIMDLTQPVQPIILQDAPKKDVSKTSKSKKTLFPNMKFILGGIVYTVVVLFLGVCIGEWLNEKYNNTKVREAAAMYEVVPAETEDEPSQEAAVNQTEDEHLQRKASLEVRTDGSDKKRKNAQETNVDPEKGNKALNDANKPNPSKSSNAEHGNKEGDETNTSGRSSTNPPVNLQPSNQERNTTNK